jgi:hypothetical protein
MKALVVLNLQVREGDYYNFELIVDFSSEIDENRHRYRIYYRQE